MLGVLTRQPLPAPGCDCAPRPPEVAATQPQPALRLLPSSWAPAVPPVPSHPSCPLPSLLLPTIQLGSLPSLLRPPTTAGPFPSPTSRSHPRRLPPTIGCCPPRSLRPTRPPGSMLSLPPSPPASITPRLHALPASITLCLHRSFPVPVGTAALTMLPARNTLVLPSTTTSSSCESLGSNSPRLDLSGCFLRLKMLNICQIGGGCRPAQSCSLSRDKSDVGLGRQSLGMLFLEVGIHVLKETMSDALAQ